MNLRSSCTSVLSLALLVFATSCSSIGKRTPEISELLGKKVALVEIEGERTSQAVAEIGIVNEILRRGSFELISKQDLATSRARPEQDPLDWRGIAKGAGADWALRVKVLKFDANAHEGYSELEEEDSLYEKETGQKKSKRLYKVKALRGEVEFNVEFADLQGGDVRTAVATKKGEAFATSKTHVERLPPKMSFLQKLSQEAFKDFFDQYE
jgi:hypothetical protein